MKSTDRKQTLLHYIVRVIQEKYPDLTGFSNELHFLDKAGSGMELKKCGQERALKPLWLSAVHFPGSWGLDKGGETGV